MDKIESEVEKLIYNLELEFIVAGLDSDGTPQLFKVSVEKEVQCYNSIGFVAIGSGTPLSFMEITKFTHRNYVELSEAVLKVYSAKKNSERVESVGSLTDLGFLSLEKEKETDKDFITNLIELPQEFKDFLDIELKAISDSENKIKTSIIEKVRDKLG
jgi:20S proteasome alpha/beta subunit